MALDRTARLLFCPSLAATRGFYRRLLNDLAAVVTGLVS